MNIFLEIGIPLIGFVIFFVFQSTRKLTELHLTIFIVIITTLMWILRYNPNEIFLFLVGLGIGMLIEVGLRIFGYQQVWKDASFFGVPYWLPLVWGIGFVIITRLGILIRGL